MVEVAAATDSPGLRDAWRSPCSTNTTHACGQQQPQWSPKGSTQLFIASYEFIASYVEPATIALANLAAGSPAIGARIGQEPGVIRSLVAMLSRSDTASVVQLQCAAALALRALIESLGNRNYIRCQLSNNLKAVRCLVRLLESRGNARARSAAGTVLATVVAHQFLTTLAAQRDAETPKDRAAAQ